jgi:beta-lactamase regulating signal transducer with metallopeptidase domain
MERLFLECTVRAALLVGVTAIVLYAMRVKAATAKHSVWAAVVALMLLLPMWVAWGPKASLRVLPPLVQSVADQAKAPLEIFSAGAARSIQVSPGLVILLSAYVLGLSVLLVRLAIGTIRARRLVRDAILRDGVRTSLQCAAPVTVGFFHPAVILPAHWRYWPKAQLDAILTHESEHARCRHPLVQWFAVLNRAIFWFHPAAWWLERHLSALAEEACDNAVLARGYDPRSYSEYLIDVARSVKQSGARLNIAGMAMPGSSLPRRIRQILEGGSVPHISRTRMVCVCLVCAVSGTSIAAGTLDHAQPNSSAEHAMIQSESAPAAHPATKFVLGDLTIKGDVHDRDGVRDRILTAWKSREYDDSKELTDEATGGIRGDFQERGYFQVVVHDASSQPLGLADGRQRILMIAPISEGEQFRLKTITIQGVTPDRAPSISLATLRDQFRLRDADLFNMTEVRAGLERLQRLYISRGYAGVSVQPSTEIDSASHRIGLTLRIAEGPHTP